MDPITLILQLALAIVQLAQANLELLKDLPPEQRTAHAKHVFEDLEAWRTFWLRLIPKP